MSPLLTRTIADISATNTHSATEITKITQYSYKSMTITRKRHNTIYYAKISTKTFNIRQKVITQCTIPRINWINWDYAGKYQAILSNPIFSHPTAATRNVRSIGLEQSQGNQFCKI